MAVWRCGDAGRSTQEITGLALQAAGRPLDVIFMSVPALIFVDS